MKIFPIEDAEMLRGKLGDAVRGERARQLILSRRESLGIAIDRRGGGINDADGVLLYGLEKDLGGEDVVVYVALKSLSPTCTDARLGGEMEDGLRPREDRGPIALDDVFLDPLEFWMRCQGFQMIVLDPDRIIIGQAIHAGDLVAEIKQTLREGRADEPGRAGDNIF